MVLLLETKGRRSGKTHITPLQYQQIGNDYYVGAARGMKSDWLLNIQSNPEVLVKVGKNQFSAIAEIVQDQNKIADFLTQRLREHPRFVGAIMQFEGFPKNPGRNDLITYAKNRVVVILHPL
jgi:deazaflavin-dependent oxidoreductase (nitroreductase family)